MRTERTYIAKKQKRRVDIQRFWNKLLNGVLITDNEDIIRVIDYLDSKPNSNFD